MFEAVRWGERGVRINTTSPGIIMTPLAKDELMGPDGAFIAGSDFLMDACVTSS
jgi:NAD(P)-dependent dehydrogenase (short-subunit alcohol dehydrogenase family)